jgi:hypothetical protein
VKKLLVIAIVLGIGACSPKAHPKIGLCEQPPERITSKITGEDWVMDSCDFDKANPGNAWCYYLMRVNGKRCLFTVLTVQCTKWKPVATVCEPGAVPTPQ